MTDHPHHAASLPSPDTDTPSSAAQTHTVFLAVGPRPLDAKEDEYLRRQLRPPGSEDGEAAQDHLLVLPLPEDTSLHTDRTLSRTLKAMHAVRAVLTFGITAHIAVIDACGVPWSRVPYRPGKLTTLPDGLIVANLPLEIWNEPDTLHDVLHRLNTHIFESA